MRRNIMTIGVNSLFRGGTGNCWRATGNPLAGTSVQVDEGKEICARRKDMVHVHWVLGARMGYCQARDFGGASRDWNCGAEARTLGLARRMDNRLIPTHVKIRFVGTGFRGRKRAIIFTHC